MSGAVGPQCLEREELRSRRMCVLFGHTLAHLERWHGIPVTCHLCLAHGQEFPVSASGTTLSCHEPVASQHVVISFVSVLVIVVSLNAATLRLRDFSQSCGLVDKSDLPRVFTELLNYTCGWRLLIYTRRQSFCAFAWEPVSPPSSESFSRARSSTS